MGNLAERAHSDPRDAAGHAEPHDLEGVNDGQDSPEDEEHAPDQEELRASQHITKQQQHPGSASRRQERLCSSPSASCWKTGRKFCFYFYLIALSSITF